MNILNDILINRLERHVLIREFQEYIWNANPKFPNPQVENILRDLAYDLDFYQSNEKLQNEDVSLYGDEKLEEQVKLALIKLQDFK